MHAGVGLLFAGHSMLGPARAPVATAYANPDAGITERGSGRVDVPLLPVSGVGYSSPTVPLRAACPTAAAGARGLVSFHHPAVSRTAVSGGAVPLGVKAPTTSRDSAFKAAAVFPSVEPLCFDKCCVDCPNSFAPASLSFWRFRSDVVDLTRPRGGIPSSLSEEAWRQLCCHRQVVWAVLLAVRRTALILSRYL